MKHIFAVACCVLLALVHCSSGDPMKEINALVEAGDIPQAKSKFKQLIAENKVPGIHRQYIQFLFDQKQFLDFRREASDYLNKEPDDQEIKLLQFDYYARLATDAERQENYRQALDYIVSWLLSPDYPQYRKWESRQTTVLKKWYEQAEAKQDPILQKEVLVTMRNLGFDNLALSVAPELYKTIEKQASEAEQAQE